MKRTFCPRVCAKMFVDNELPWFLCTARAYLLACHSGGSDEHSSRRRRQLARRAHPALVVAQRPGDRAAGTECASCAFHARKSPRARRGARLFVTRSRWLGCAEGYPYASRRSAGRVPDVGGLGRDLRQGSQGRGLRLRGPAKGRGRPREGRRPVDHLGRQTDPRHVEPRVARGG